MAETISSSIESRSMWRVVRRRYNLVSLLLAFSLFGTGACGLVTEYLLATVSSYLLGSTIEQFSIIIALMMVMMGISTWVQRYIGDDNQIERLILVEVFMAWLCGFAPSVLYGAFSVLETHFALVQYFFVVSIGFLIGFEIPLVLRINEKYVDSLKSNIAGVVSFDYLGAFIGAIVWAFVLLRHFALTEISFLVASLNFAIAVAAFTVFVRRRMVRRPGRLGGLIVVTGVGLVLGFTYNQSWSALFEQRLYDNKIIHSTTTRYQHIVLTHNQTLDEYRLFINGNLQFSSWDEHIYHEHLIHLPMHLTRGEDVLILGGGDFLAAREVLKYPEVSGLTIVDLDPGMTRFCCSHPALVALSDSAMADARTCVIESGAITPDTLALSKSVYMETGQFDRTGEPIVTKVAEVSVINMDADRFLSTIRGRRFDLVVMDFPDPNSVELGKLYSKEFFVKLRENVLAENGLLVTQATSPVHAKESFLNIMRTMQAAGLQVIPYHDNVPSFGEWGWILGWKSETPVAGMKGRIDQITTIRVATDYLTPAVMKAALVFGKDALKSSHPDEINTLMRPTLHSVYVRECWRLE